MAVERGGGCSFSDKALAAQAGGAVACIVLNNQPGGVCVCLCLCLCMCLCMCVHRCLGLCRLCGPPCVRSCRSPCVSCTGIMRLMAAPEEAAKVNIPVFMASDAARGAVFKAAREGREMLARLTEEELMVVYEKDDTL